MGESMMISVVCSRGLIREKNEDNLYFDGKYLPQHHEGLKAAVTIRRECPPGAAFAVFDGMGGEQKGELASYLAAEVFHRCIETAAEQEEPESFLIRACEAMNDRICEEMRAQGIDSMGTTMASLLFGEGEAVVCNLGDSPIFRLRDGVLERLHEEHTDRRFMEEQGITGRKPYLTQCLGIPKTEMMIQPCIRHCELKEGDQYLICSDGLTDLLTDEQIQMVMEEELTPGECLEKLLAQVLERGARDNTTMILIRTISLRQE